MRGQILVDVWTDSYAPCMVQLRARRADITARIKVVVKANGGAWDDKTDSALLSWDCAEHYLRKRQLAMLRRGWEVTVKLDPWVFAHFYGWDAHTALE